MRFGEARFKVKLSRKARNYYERLDPHTAARVDRALEALEQDPSSGDVKAIKGEPGTWRVQVGGLRIVYEVDKRERTVTVLVIRPRGDVYKH